MSLLPVYSLILLFCNSSPKDAKPKLVPNQNIPAVYPSREEHVMVAQSLEQDSSWSLESSQGWLMLVGHGTSAGRHDTKPTLVAAFDFISCLVGWGLQRGETPGQCPCTHISPSLHLPNPAPFLLPAGPEVVLPERSLRQAGAILLRVALQFLCQHWPSLQLYCLSC